jgi:hypothetical protein
MELVCAGEAGGGRGNGAGAETIGASGITACSVTAGSAGGMEVTLLGIPSGEAQPMQSAKFSKVAAKKQEALDLKTDTGSF